MENNETRTAIAIEDILSVFKKKSEEKKMKDIKVAVIGSRLDSIDLFDGTQEQLEKEIEDAIKADKKLGDFSKLTYSKGKYKQRKEVATPGGADAILQSNDFTGRAGECAVMAELLFRGYNVNRMMVDGGIDLVGFKNSNYYFYQVKTVGVKNNTIIASIPIENFEKDRRYASQMRYVIVGRYTDKQKNELNHFFVFTHNEIERAIYGQTIKLGQQSISIKIRFDKLTGKPILYDVKEDNNAEWHLNRFDAW